MSEIITLTTAATTQVKKLLQQKATGVFRIAVDDSGCSGKKYVVEIVAQPQADDQAIKITDDLSIYIDHESIKFLQGAILDCQAKGLGMWQWVFENPKAKNNCGCGESFTTGENKE